MVRKRAKCCFESTGNTVSRVLFRKRELIEFAPNSVSSAKNLVRLRWHTYDRLKGTHEFSPPEFGEGQKTH